MSYPLTIHGPMPAADWVTDNTLLAQFEIGQELDGGVYGGAKMGPGHWNSLGYWNPAGGIALLSSTQVHTNVGTKQSLYTVPTGFECVVTMEVLRKVSGSLALLNDQLNFGFNAGADDNRPVSTPILALLTGSTKASVNINGPDFNTAIVTPVIVGTAGQVFGCVFADTAITATLQIDTFGYLIKA